MMNIHTVKDIDTENLRREDLLIEGHGHLPKEILFTNKGDQTIVDLITLLGRLIYQDKMST